MDVNDYLIEQTGKDWPELLSSWSPPLPESFEIWLVNRFGDVLAAFDDGSIHMLDVSTGEMTRIADDRDHFCTLIDLGNNANDWLMIPLIDRCVAAGMILRGNQCYGYKIPPMLDGACTVENIEPTDLSVHYSLHADIYNQVKDLPDGTKIRVVVATPPSN